MSVVDFTNTRNVLRDDAAVFDMVMHPVRAIHHLFIGSINLSLYEIESSSKRNLSIHGVGS